MTTRTTLQQATPLARKFSLIAVIFACIALGGLSALWAQQEYRVARLDLSDPFESFDAWHEGEMPIAVSVYTSKKMAQSCIEAMLSYWSKFEADERQDIVSDHCAAYAEGLEAYGHIMGETQLIRAAHLIDEGDVEAGLIALTTSQALAPYESWIARYRFGVALTLYETGELEAKTVLARELSAMISSSFGVDRAAKLYVTRPDLRPLFLDASASVSPSQRARFLAYVRQFGT